MSAARSPVLAVAVAAGVCLSGLGSRAEAADESSAEILPGDVLDAITGNIDDDDERELVRVIVDPNRPGRLLVDALEFDGERWTVIGATDVVRQSEDQAAHLPINIENDGFGLLAWNDGTAERVLLVTNGDVTNGDVADDAVGCCLTVSLVTAGGGGLDVTPLPGTFGDGELVAVLDFDADGTDELLVVGLSRDEPEGAVRVLRWNGADAFDASDVGLRSGAAVSFHSVVVGESDGTPGEEAVIAAGDDQLWRFAVSADGAIDVERRIAPLADMAGIGGVFGLGGGFFATATSDGVHLLSWPRGGEFEVARSRRLVDRLNMAVLSAGDHAAIIDFSGIVLGEEPEHQGAVYDVNLAAHSIPPNRSIEAMTLRDLQGFYGPVLTFGLSPYVGPLYGGFEGGADAFLLEGTAVVLAADGEISFRFTNGLIGAAPVGIAGPDDAWVVLTDLHGAPTDAVYLFPWTSYVPAQPPARLVAVPLADVFVDEPPDATLEPELSGAWLTDGRAGEPLLVVGDAGFSATVDAPAGSTVHAVHDTLIPVSDVAGEEPMTIHLEPRAGGSGNESFEALIVVLRPDGAVQRVIWNGRVLRDAPELSVFAETPLFSMRSRVSGRVSEAASVTVDGIPVTLDPGGRFSTGAEASIWPRPVVVVARDLVGNESVERLEIVGFVDYRGLPWQGLVAVGTAMFGVLLFLRIPRFRGDEPAADEDGTLEVFDGD